MTTIPAPDFNSGRVLQPGGAAIISTPQGVSDVAVSADDLPEVKDAAAAETAEAVAAPKPRRSRKPVMKAADNG